MKRERNQQYEEYMRKINSANPETVVNYRGKLMPLRQAKRMMKWDGFTAKLRANLIVRGPYIIALGVIIGILVWLF